MNIDTVRKLLEYDPVTGIFAWRKTGKVAGRVGKDGYRRISFRSETYLASRLAVFYMTGIMPKGNVVHDNKNRSDDRFSNLHHNHTTLDRKPRSGKPVEREEQEEEKRDRYFGVFFGNGELGIRLGAMDFFVGFRRT